MVMILIKVLTALAVVYVAWLAWVNVRWPGEPPLITGYVPFLGVALTYAADSVAYLRQLRQRFGDVFTLYIAGQRMHFVLNPRDVPKILRRGKRDLQFGPIGWEIGTKAFQYSTATENDEMEKWVHDWYIKTLRGEALDPLTVRFQQELTRKLSAMAGSDGWSRDGNLWDFNYELMFDAAAITMFGKGLPLREAMRDFETFDAKFPLIVGGAPDFQVADSRKACARIAALMVDQGDRRATASTFITGREDKFREAKLPGDDRERLHVTMMWAIMGNTIPAAFWALWFVYSDPDVVAALRAEIRSAVREIEGCAKWEIGDPLPKLGRHEMDRFVALESAALEAMRLAANSTTIRRVMRNTTLELESGTFKVRRGDAVMVAPAIWHVDANLHRAPDSFVWDRFLERPESDSKATARGARIRNSFALGDAKIRKDIAIMPFGGGVSMCPGRYFAINEIKSLLVSTLSAFDLEVRGNPTVSKSRVGLGIQHVDGKATFRIRPVRK